MDFSERVLEYSQRCSKLLMVLIRFMSVSGYNSIIITELATLGMKIVFEFSFS